MMNSRGSGFFAACIRAIFHTLPVLGPCLSPDHGPATGLAGLAGQKGLITAKRLPWHREFLLKINNLGRIVLELSYLYFLALVADRKAL